MIILFIIFCLSLAAVFFYFNFGGDNVERVQETINSIDVFENDIDLYLHEFCEINQIDDLKKESQAVWNGCMMYIQRKVFGDKRILKQSNNIQHDNSIMDSTYNRYNYELVSTIADYYIYICNMYNKEISIMGFSKLTGIDNDTICEWGNNGRILSEKGSVIYKKLIKEREESLSNKLADGRQNPVGVLAILNRHYQWNLPGVSKETTNNNRLTAAELPKLGPDTRNVVQIEQKETDR